MLRSPRSDPVHKKLENWMAKDQKKRDCQKKKTYIPFKATFRGGPHQNDPKCKIHCWGPQIEYKIGR